ncbi:hypothetical protein PHMEG_00027305 [Phytophthora megakarya]|uniref:Ndc10 domain-containing protein n=1 Tax=Phytophthora megakarya TaxID=4795 RepID=A0A225V7P9_9STRA|nr:hypothetical protein PHMEG_00027305 [Phytophthora megakarya]
MAWCDTQGAAFSDLTRYTVTGPKLHLFLKECVIGRPKRHKSGKECSNEGATEVEGGSEARIFRIGVVGKATISCYVAAIVDLWQQQTRAKVNGHPTPRDDAVRALIKMVEFDDESRKRKNFADRGSDTLLDGYTTNDQIQNISTYFWAMRRDHGTNLRNLLAFLLSHYALMRGESARKMELADLHSIRLENEGYSPCRAVVMIKRQGKTNQVGRTEVGACMRNKKVQICPTGFWAFTFFWRCHCDQEPFPDFSRSETWYPVKLLKHVKIL